MATSGITLPDHCQTSHDIIPADAVTANVFVGLGRVDVERSRCAHPFHILVVVNAHHQPAAHADDGQHGQKFLQPDVHDAYFSLSPAVWSFDYRREVHALLQNVVGTFVSWNGIDVFFGRSNYYA